MTILEALNDEKLETRIVLGDRWLVMYWGDQQQMYGVYQSQNALVGHKIIIETSEEDAAVAALLDQ